VVQIRDAYEARLRRIMSEGVKDGSFEKVDVATTGCAVLSMLNWMAPWHRPGGSRTAARVATDCGNLLLRGL
jgi:hypothetical protein